VHAAERQRRPLGSAQIKAHSRQVAQQAQHDEAEALAEEAALLEAMAEEQAWVGNGEVTHAGGSTEEEWRRYWTQYHDYYGVYPGEPAASPPATPPQTFPSTPPPAATPTPPPPPMPVEPPAAWASLGACVPDAEGSVRVPVQLVQRYQELEWRDWQSRYQEWCAAFEAWKLASPQPMQSGGPPSPLP
jgi:hypothetical protein